MDKFKCELLPRHEREHGKALYITGEPCVVGARPKHVNLLMTEEKKVKNYLKSRLLILARISHHRSSRDGARGGVSASRTKHVQVRIGASHYLLNAWSLAPGE